MRHGWQQRGLIFWVTVLILALVVVTVLLAFAAQRLLDAEATLTLTSIAN